MRSAFLSLILVAPIIAQWPNGNPSCPCITDPYEPGTKLVLERSDDGVRYNLTYGTVGCNAYDLTATPECARVDAASRPRWCAAKWCYINATSCARSSRPSSYFVDVSSNATGAHGGVREFRRGKELAAHLKFDFSYTTCGYIDYFSDSTHAYQLNAAAAASQRPNGRLRVAFPGDSSSMYTVVGATPYPDGTRKVAIGAGVGGSNRSGSSLTFMDSVLRRLLGVEWEVVPISARSHEYAPTSSYTACVHEVAIENVDVCFGSFWPTAARREMTSFSAAYHVDSFRLVVPLNAPQTPEELLWAALNFPFAPFTGALWGLVFVAFSVIGVAMALEFKWLDLRQKEAGRALSWHEFFALVPVSVLRGWHAFSTGEIRQLPLQTSGGWLTQFALGFTKTVLLAAYTSVCVSSLVVSQGLQVNSLDDVVRLEYTICIYDQIIEELVAGRPELAPLLVAGATAHTVGRRLSTELSGVCQAAIIDRDGWLGANLWGETKHCTTKAMLDETLLTNFHTVPTSDALAPAISWAISRAVQQGEYASLAREARQAYTYGLCSAAVSGMPPTTITQFGLAELGPLVGLCLVIALVSLALTRVGRRMSAAGAAVERAIDADGDGKVSGAEVRVAIRRAAWKRPSRKGRLPSNVKADVTTASHTEAERP